MTSIRQKGNTSVAVKPRPISVEKRIDVVIVSVNYNDFLLITLEQNIKIFDNITVVTSESDEICKKICDKFGVKCIQTNIMYENGDKFNKGKAINTGIKSIENPQLILILDADILVGNKIDSTEIESDTIYTSGRTILESYPQYLRWKEDGTIKARVESNRGLGFFHLFDLDSRNVNKSCPYPENYPNADGSDLIFRNSFKYRKDANIQATHLGVAYKNWKGRRSESFIPIEKVYEQIGLEVIKSSKLESEIESEKFDINNYFDKIYCINLEKRKDRWIRIKKIFNKYKIHVERFIAIDGENLENGFQEEISSVKASRLGLLENKNAIGCLLSHLEIIKKAKEQNYKRILIFEDDIIFSNSFNKDITKIKDLDWDMVYLGASQFNWIGIEIKNGFYRCENTLGTFAYGINSSIFDKIIKKIENNNNKSVDNLYTEIQKEKINCFTFYPNLVISDVENSDIRQSTDNTLYSKQVRWNLENFSDDSIIKSISIIIPCFGHSNFIEECVESCLNQTIGVDEIIVLLMDEESYRIKEKIEQKSKLIKCFISEKKFLSSARNFLVDKVESDYFIPLDADDKLPENFVEEISRINADVVYVGSKYFGSSQGTWPDPIIEEIDWTKLTTFRRNSLVCTALIKKESFLISGKYNDELWAFEDMDLWIRMYKNNFEFKKCFNTFLSYRKHNSNSSLLSQANSNIEKRNSLKKIILKDNFYSRIPKIIHWVWLGEKPIPSKIVETWKKHLPEGEWTYMLWNEKNFDMKSCDFLSKSYSLKKYGICVDYMRAKVLSEYGGIWLDADCIINNDISPFLQFDFFASWENENYLNIGILGCSPNLEVMNNILKYYTKKEVDEETIKSHNRFVKEVGTGPIVLTNEVMKIRNIRNGGFKEEFINNSKKFIIETPDVFVLDDTRNGRTNYAVHLFDGSWTEKKEEWSVIVRKSYENWKIKNKI